MRAEQEREEKTYLQQLIMRGGVTPFVHKLSLIV